MMAIGDKDGKLAARIPHFVVVTLRPYYVVALLDVSEFLDEQILKETGVLRKKSALNWRLPIRSAQLLQDANALVVCWKLGAHKPKTPPGTRWLAHSHQP